MAAIRISVGASRDRSVDAVFAGIVQQAKRASAQVSAEMVAAAKAEAKEAKAAAAAQKAGMAATLAAKRAWAREDAAIEKQRARETKAEAKEIERVREAVRREDLQAARAQARELATIAKQEATRQKQDANRDRASMASVRSGLARGAASVGRFALGVGADLVRGIGVDTSMGSHFQNAANLETSATLLSNQGFMDGKAPRVDPSLLIKQARQTANDTGFSANDIIEAQSTFVGKTGDLKTSQAIMLELGRIAKATGTDITDMADAAGDVSNQLGDIPNKGAVVADIMKAIAAQGKEGAVEIKDLATQMAKVGAAAGQFEGGADSIKTFGALAQFARQRGGAASATQAATSTLGFANVFGKGARLDAFQSYGVQTKGAGGLNRNPVDIIIDSLKATKGDTRKMGEMFADVSSQRVVKPFQQTFNREYEEAIKSGKTDQEALNIAAKAAREEFEKLAAATMSEKELTDSFAATMNTSQAKAQLFNNQMDELAADVKDELLPAIQSLVPVIKDELVPALKTAIKFIAWFGSSNEDNSEKVESATATAENALNSGDPAQIAAAQEALQTAADNQGEDRTGTAHHFLKGFLSAGYGQEKDAAMGEDGRLAQIAAFSPVGGIRAGYAGVKGGLAQVEAGKAEDDRSIKAQTDAVNELKKLNAAIAAKAPPSAAAPDVNALGAP